MKLMRKLHSNRTRTNNMGLNELRQVILWLLFEALLVF